MQRIVQINIAGRVLPIEEDAYTILTDYINALEGQFTGDDGKEIAEEIENRISELFTIRLQSGAPSIDRSDVQKVIDTLGSASDLHDGARTSQGQNQNTPSGGSPDNTGTGNSYKKLLRDPYDRVIGGVCSGIAHYFEIDPVLVRLISVAIMFAGVGVIAYIVAWAVIPAAATRDELRSGSNGSPITFHDISRNVEKELQDLKKRGEQMSRELKDFFSKKRNP